MILSFFKSDSLKKNVSFCMFLTVFHCFSKGESIFRSFAHKKTNDSLETSIQYKYIFVFSFYSQGPVHRSLDFYFMYITLYNILQDAGIWTRAATQYTYPFNELQVNTSLLRSCTILYYIV